MKVPIKATLLTLATLSGTVLAQPDFSLESVSDVKPTIENYVIARSPLLHNHFLQIRATNAHRTTVEKNALTHLGNVSQIEPRHLNSPVKTLLLFKYSPFICGPTSEGFEIIGPLLYFFFRR